MGNKLILFELLLKKKKADVLEQVFEVVEFQACFLIHEGSNAIFSSPFWKASAMLFNVFFGVSDVSIFSIG